MEEEKALVNQLYITVCVCVCVPAEDRPLVFGVHSESDGLLAGHRAHRLRGDGLTGRGIFLGLLVVAVRAVGRRAVRGHQGRFPRHAHAPHARCRQSHDSHFNAEA